MDNANKINTDEYGWTHEAHLGTHNGQPAYRCRVFRKSDKQVGDLVWLEPNLTCDDEADACDWNFADLFDPLDIKFDDDDRAY